MVNQFSIRRNFAVRYVSTCAIISTEVWCFSFLSTVVKKMSELKLIICDYHLQECYCWRNKVASICILKRLAPA